MTLYRSHNDLHICHGTMASIHVMQEGKISYGHHQCCFHCDSHQRERRRCGWKDTVSRVRLMQCLEALLGSEGLDYACPSCAHNVQVCFLISCTWNGTHLVFRQLRFESLPEILVMHAKKCQLVNWVPAKLGPFISFHHLGDLHR